MAISKKVTERISAGIKRYQGILAEARRRDISESDTAVIVGDMLADLLGYKKYVDITTEFAIRNTYVDLAVKVGQEVRFLIEVKPIGVVELKDPHIKQAIDYGANQGIEWVVLTNAATWRVYKINFQQPIDKSLVFDLDLLSVSPKNSEVLECLFTLSREGFTQSSMTALLQQRQATSKFSVAAVLLSDGVITAARRELRRRFPDVRIDDELLRSVIEHEALKREVVDGDEARAAQELLKRGARRAARIKAREEENASASKAASTAANAKPAAEQHVKP
jgi:hypothetical protein